MRTLLLVMLASLLAVPAVAEPPALGYVAVADPFKLLPGMNFGGVSGVAINSKGHIFILHRGPGPLMEFTPEGAFVRAWGDQMFDRPHGLRIDAEDNIWTTDVGSNLVMKFNPEGRLVLVLGVKGQTGEWHPYGHLPLFSEPNDVAIGPAGEIFVAQGHGKAESRILKFDRDGNFIKSWGKKGKGPAEFDIAHSIVIDRAGLIYIADRNNQRIQVFDLDGNYVRETKHPGTPCGLFITADQQIFMAHGHAGQVIRLDLNGKVLGVMGKQGKALGQFGEAHFIAVSRNEEAIYVADTLNWRVQKFVKSGS
jgi:DNA-binding beta-propeller fold protein YncE